MSSPRILVKTQEADYGSTSDAELVGLAMRPDARAFRELISRYGQLVYNHSYRMTQNAEQSEEITQDVFMKVYRNLDKFDVRRPFRPWLMRIAANTSISMLRKNRNVVSITELEESGFDVADNEDTSLNVELKMSAEELLVLMQQLDARYRQALILRYCEDLPYEDIAAIMDVPLNTVRTWLKRGKERLAKLVTEKQS